MGFIRRNKFWIVIAGAGVAGALLLFFVWLPLRAESREAFESFKDRSHELERVARDDIRGEDSIDRLNRRAEELQRFLSVMRAELYEYYADTDLEVRFDQDTAAYSIFRNAFKRLYDERIEDLRKRFHNSVPEVSSGFLEPRSVPEYIDPEDAFEIEKEYQAQKAILDVIIRLNEDFTRVPVANSFSLGSPGDRGDIVLLREIHKEEDLFYIWPFQLDFTMQLDYLPDLLGAFARSPYRIEVFSLDEIGRRFASGLVLREIDVRSVVNFVEEKVAADDLRGAKKVVTLVKSIGRLSGDDLSAIEAAEGRVDEALGEDLEDVREQIAVELEDMGEQRMLERMAEWTDEVDLPDEMVGVRIRGYLPEYRRPYERELLSVLDDADRAVEELNFERAERLLNEVRGRELYKVSARLQEKAAEISETMDELLSDTEDTTQ